MSGRVTSNQILGGRGGQNRQNIIDLHLGQIDEPCSIKHYFSTQGLECSKAPDLYLANNLCRSLRVLPSLTSDLPYLGSFKSISTVELLRKSMGRNESAVEHLGKVW